ncbi:hypothetical protein [Streptomyces sp. HD]|nr:hypothetical protein [Streptomyces sp. HD]MDC0769053.1 hypothetical protein [Streptomyces sp. HD]
MLLTVFMTAGFIGLLVLLSAGWLTDRLHGDQASKDSDRMLNS